MTKTLTKLLSRCIAAGIRQWVRWTGRRINVSDVPWLQCPVGTTDRIGADFYQRLASEQGYSIEPVPHAGLLVSLDDLHSPQFDAKAIRPEIRDFYERTSDYQLEAWSESGSGTRIFLWGLTRFVSRDMDQLNFPVSSLELAGGMSSEVLPMIDATGTRIYTGWLRRLTETQRVIYAGFYSVAQVPESDAPCVKVSFPLPKGSATVFLRPELQSDGSLRLTTEGSKFGDVGFYRIVADSGSIWRVRRIKTLKENFHVYVDQEGILRTDHTVRFLGLTPLRLHYKITKKS